MKLNCSTLWHILLGVWAAAVIALTGALCGAVWGVRYTLDAVS